MFEDLGDATFLVFLLFIIIIFCQLRGRYFTYYTYFTYMCTTSHARMSMLELRKKQNGVFARQKPSLIHYV